MRDTAAGLEDHGRAAEGAVLIHAGARAVKGLQGRLPSTWPLTRQLVKADEDFEARDPGYMEVQKDHVRLEGGHKFKSLDAGAGASDVITQLGEKDFEQVGDLGVIVHDEDAGDGSRGGHSS